MFEPAVHESALLAIQPGTRLPLRVGVLLLARLSCESATAEKNPYADADPAAIATWANSGIQGNLHDESEIVSPPSLETQRSPALPSPC